MVTAAHRFGREGVDEFAAEWIDVRGNDGVGMWSVPVVRLIDDSTEFPSYGMLWLPKQRRYASYDMEDSSLYVFAEGVSWTTIKFEFESYFSARLTAVVQSTIRLLFDSKS